MGILKRIRLTIGTKLVSLIAVLLLTSIVSLVWLATRMFSEDNMALISKINADTAENLANQTRELFESTAHKMMMLGTFLVQDFPKNEMRVRVVEEFFSKDKDLLHFFVHKQKDDGTLELVDHACAPELRDSTADPNGAKAAEALFKDKHFSSAQLAKGEVQLATVKLEDGSPAIALSLPFGQTSPERYGFALTAFIRQSKFLRAFNENDIITSFMVDRYGKLIAHPDANRVAAAESVAHLAIVKEMLEGKFNNKQMRYVDGEPRLGAYRTLGFAGLGVVAEVPEAKAFETTRRVQYRSMLVALTILCISFFVGYLYSGTITWPIQQLARAARQISEGDFNINLKPRGRDEIAMLSTSFNEMARGLEERDRVKATFNKFHNKEIAEKLLSGEVKLGGERREATIFFSDVRGFTGMSESMQPEEVVVMLNEYMTRMVSIIRTFGGVVDKYVGDAIMALWGVPIGGEHDVENAVRACLAMRQELAALNELRISRGQPVLKIGMGLNTGPVIAGNIGSDEKMEYTVIGDSVNLASRIESMTKEYGTDLLISKNVHDRISPTGRFVIEACKTAKVKGKSTAIEVFKVRGLIGDNGETLIIETPYSSYAAEKSDKVVHDSPGPAQVLSEATTLVQRSHDLPPPPPPKEDTLEQPVIRAAKRTRGTRSMLVSNTATLPLDPAQKNQHHETATLFAPNLREPEPAAASPTVLEAPTRVATPENEIIVPSSDEKERTKTRINTPVEQTGEIITMGSAYYVNDNGEIFGPFTRDEILVGLKTKELTGAMQVCKDLLKPQWVAIAQLPEFKEQAAA